MRKTSAAPSVAKLRSNYWSLFTLLLLMLPRSLFASGTCQAGSGTCSDDFKGASGTVLTAYNPAWTKVKATSDIYTTGSGSVAIAGTSYAYYSYANSSSDTSQLTVEPSRTTTAYTREACVRLTPGLGGYCVGFGGVINGSYINCYVEKSGQWIGSVNCGAVPALLSHTLSIVASDSTNTTLSIYLDGKLTGSVIDQNQPYTNHSSGLALIGSGNPADSMASSWHDFLAAPTGAALEGVPAPAFACSSGSGSCYDTFAGEVGADLVQYNSLWKKAAGTASAYTTGSKSVRVPGHAYAYYYYAASNADTSQIVVNPSTGTTAYAREACVRVTQDKGGYCVSLGGAVNGTYSNCYVEKSGQYIGNAACGPRVSTTTHTLGITAKGTSPVTLQVYLDGAAMRPVVDNVGTLQQLHSGFALIGDGVAEDSDAGTWRDYREVMVTPAPTFAPLPGTYSSAQNVVLSSNAISAVIHYTLNGSTPTMISPIYSGPIKVASSVSIKAIALVEGQTLSTVSTANYSINPPTLPSPTFSKSSPYAGPATNVAILNSVSGAQILYCQDLSNTCVPTIPYTGMIDFSTNGFIRAQSVLTGYLASATSSWQGTWSTAQILTTSCPEGTQYKTYSGCTISVSGGLPPYVFGWSKTTNNGLVEGLSLNPVTGTISGTVYGQGIYSVPFTVTDATNSTVTKVVTMPMRGDNTLGGCSLFPADSVWHLNVANLPVDTSPAAPILPDYINMPVHLVFGQNLDDGGIPFLRVPYDQKNVPVSTTQYQSYFTSGPFPLYAPVEATQNSGEGADRHVSIVQMGGGGNHCKLWEMWHGAPTGDGSSWTDASNAYWDLGSYDMLPQDNGSTDAAGLPIAPLLWNYDEVAGGCAPGAECGVVKHPARLTFNHTLQRHVWPATAQSGQGSCTGGYQDYNHLLSQSNPPTSCVGSGPMGEIYRLKSSTSSPASCVGHSQAQVLLTALRNYGLIIADNGISGGVVATADSRWDDNDLSCLTSLKMSDFEPVNVSSKMIDLNSSQTAP